VIITKSHPYGEWRLQLLTFPEIQRLVIEVSKTIFFATILKYFPTEMIDCHDIFVF